MNLQASNPNFDTTGAYNNSITPKPQYNVYNVNVEQSSINEIKPVENGNIQYIEMLVSNKIPESIKFVRISENGYIESVYIINNAENNPVIKVRITILRKQKVGDKMTARYSQIGTFGDTRPFNLMPKVSSGPNEGLVPDLVINAKAFSSRMTSAIKKEIMLSKVALLELIIINATTFNEFNDQFDIHILKNKFVDCESC